MRRQRGAYLKDLVDLHSVYSPRWWNGGTLEWITPDIVARGAENEVFAGITPLGLACDLHYVEMVQWLLEDRHVDPNITSDVISAGRSWSPMHFAAACGGIETGDTGEAAIRCIRLLHAHGAAIDVLNNNCDTPLTVLISFSRRGNTHVRNVASVLIDLGANLYLVHGIGAPDFIHDYYDARVHRRAVLRVLGSIVCVRVRTKDTQRLLMKNAK